MKRLFFPTCVLAGLALVACNNNPKNASKQGEDSTQMMHANHEMHGAHEGHDGHQGHDMDNMEQGNTAIARFENVSKEVGQHIAQVQQHYLALKDALVKDDAKTAAGSAKQMVALIDGFDLSHVPVAQLDAYRMPIDRIQKQGSAISMTDDIESQRLAFSQLTEGVYNLSQQFGAPGGALYYDHCPMAFNNKGANWLSNRKEIENPYFGDKMLSCGSTKATIQ